MPAPCSECPDCGDILPPSVPIYECINCAAIILTQIAMADRLAHAEEQSNEVPPYYWDVVDMFGNGNGDGNGSDSDVAPPSPQPATQEGRASQ